MGSNSEAAVIELATAGVSERSNHSAISVATERLRVSNSNGSGEEELQQQMAEAEELGGDVRRLLPLALLIVGVTFAAMFAVPGGLKDHGKEQGSATMGDTVAFDIFLVSDIAALLASMMVAAILQTIAPLYIQKLGLFIQVALGTALGSAALAFLAAAYIVVPPGTKWVAVAVGVGTASLLCAALLYIISFC